MEYINSFFDFFLSLGPSVFLPVLITIMGTIFGMKFSKAFSAGIILGVAFVGMGVVINFMFTAITPASEAFVANTGAELKAIDVGWAPMSTIAWAWPYAILMFPIQITINLIMLSFKLTKTLNVDLWNVWSKVLTATLVTTISGNVPLGLLAGAIQVVLELITADTIKPRVEKLTGIPGVTVTQGMLLFVVVLDPIDRVLKKIPALNKKMDANILKAKIGIFGENHIMGFFIGVFIAMLGGFSIPEALIVGVETGTALVLFPMVAKLFMQSLAPFSEAAASFMKKRNPDLEFYVGLDWPILAGRSEMWVVMILLVPVALILAILVPGNIVLPLAGILALGITVPSLVVTNANLIRMFILGFLAIPFFLFVGTVFAGTITELAISTNAFEIPEGSMISWFGLETPIYRLAVSALASVNYMKVGIALLIGYIGLFFLYNKNVKKDNLS